MVARIVVVIGVAVSLGCGVCMADPPAATVPVADPDTIELNLPPNVQLHILIDYVAMELKLNIVYDRKVAGEGVTLAFKGKVKRSALLTILRAVLQLKGLALRATDAPDVLTISSIKAPGTSGAKFLATRPAGMDPQQVVTQVIELKHVAAEKAKGWVQPFLSSKQAHILVVSEQNLLLITDYASQLARALDLLERVDKPGQPREFRTYAVRHVDAAKLAPRIAKMAFEKASAEPAVGGRRSGPQQRVSVTADAETNRLIITGPKASVEAALELAAEFDVASTHTSELFHLQYVSADRMAKLVEQVFPADVARINRVGEKAVSVDTEGRIAEGWPPFYTPGWTVAEHKLPRNPEWTIYTRFGDWFPAFCGLMWIGLICAEYVLERKRRKALTGNDNG